MPLLSVVLTLVVVGLLLWLVNRFIPMQGQIKAILNGVVVVAVILWLVKVFGLLDYLPQLGVGQPLLTILITLAVAGLLLFLINRFIPMQGQIKGILNGVVVVVLALWVMKSFGLFAYVTQFRVGH
jgi:hypothetical protein